jgi:hypothetical protein
LRENNIKKDLSLACELACALIDHALIDHALRDLARALIDHALIDHALIDHALIDHALIDHALIDRDPAFARIDPELFEFVLFRAR